MKRTIGFMFIVFAGVLGAAVAHKMSSEAMAVVVGVVMGVLASFPMAILMLVVMRKSMQSQAPAQPQQPQQQYPPVIVVSGQPQLPGPQQADGWAVDGQWRPAEPERQFKMLGED